VFEHLNDSALSALLVLIEALSHAQAELNDEFGAEQRATLGAAVTVFGQQQRHAEPCGMDAQS